jgi:leucyl aminopeptidase
MNVTPISTGPLETDADAIVLGCFASDDLHPELKDIDEALSGAISRSSDFTGAANQIVAFATPSSLKAATMVLIGLGPESDWSPQAAARAAGTAAHTLAKKQLNKVAFFFPEQHTAHAIAAAINGCTGQDLYRSKKSLFPFPEILWRDAKPDDTQHGTILGDAVALTRTLVNEPASEIYPHSFAQRAEEIGSASGFETEIWDEEKLRTENCGAILAVGQGSAKPPCIVIMRYRGGRPGDAPLCLVGKGVTFDSGGLSIKPSEGMESMKCDMAGAATVLGAMQAIAKLKLPVNVTGIAGLAENMVSSTSYKLGDVITTRLGKTIEVLNTDAEGRLVLSDALDIAVRHENAAKIIDLATLTGACVVALGEHIAGAMTNDDAWCAQILSAAKASGERVWQLPMDADFTEQIQSKIADIKNLGDTRWGGAITAAKLLQEFVGTTPWVHLDIAGPAFSSKPKPWIDGGASGCLVKTLVHLASS